MPIYFERCLGKISWALDSKTHARSYPLTHLRPDVAGLSEAAAGVWAWRAEDYRPLLARALWKSVSAGRCRGWCRSFAERCRAEHFRGLDDS